MEPTARQSTLTPSNYISITPGRYACASALLFLAIRVLGGNALRGKGFSCTPIGYGLLGALTSTATLMGLKALGLYFFDKSKRMAEVADYYCAFIKEFSLLGPKEAYFNPPWKSMTTNCQRIFNGIPQQQTRAAFVELLTTFYKANGPWDVQIKEKIVAPESNSVILMVSVKIMGVDHTEVVRLGFNERLQINKIEAVLAPVGASV